MLPEWWSLAVIALLNIAMATAMLSYRPRFKPWRKGHYLTAGLAAAYGFGTLAWLMLG